MSFIKLNQTKLNYQQRDQYEDVFILSDIVDSSISPEYPKIIRTTDELAIYFGTNWDQYNYYIQLLSSGVSLFLFKPLLGKDDDRNYEIIECEEELPEEPKEDTLYLYKDEYYIYNSEVEDLIKYNDLPENSGSPENSPSWLNRESLGLSRNGELSHYYPKYLDQPNSDEEEYSFPYLRYRNRIKESLQNYGILDDSVSFSLSLDFTNVSPKEWETSLDEDAYITISKVAQDNKSNSRFNVIWVNNHTRDFIEPPTAKFIPDELIDGKHPVDYYYYFYDATKEEMIDSIVTSFNSMGFYSKKEGDIITIGSSDLLRVSSFTNIPGLVISSNQEISNQIIIWGNQEENQPITPRYYRLDDQGNKIYYKYLPQNYLEFYSRLLGKSIDPITVTIEKSQVYNEVYQVTISKLNYSEFFQGRLDYQPFGGEIKNLEVEINKNSKLVYCQINNYYSVQDDLLITSSIPEGTWELSGGEYEMITPRTRWNGLRALEFTNIQEDFFLISDIQKWRYSGIGDWEYYPEYLQLLEYAKTKNCQILVQNNQIVPVVRLQNTGTTYYLGKKILNGNQELQDKLITLQAAKVHYQDIKVTKDIEVNVDPGVLKQLKSNGLVVSGKDYKVSQIEINEQPITNTTKYITEYTPLVVNSDTFSNLKVGDTVKIKTSNIKEGAISSLKTISSDDIISDKITAFKFGDSLINEEGDLLKDKVEENQSQGVVKINNNFYKISEDNVVTKVSSLKANDTLTEISVQDNKLLEISKGFIVDSKSGKTVSENTKEIDIGSDNKFYKINNKIINHLGNIISNKIENLSTKSNRKGIPVIYAISEKYYNSLNQEEENDKEFALPWGNDFYFNYTGDPENRIIYFLGDFKVDGIYQRPGYYYFLKGILFNNWEIDKVIYDYEERDPIFEISDYSKQLQSKKSNYISLYNNSYHYNKFFWDTTGLQNYHVSGTLKYCQSRISRLFERYKWSLLGFQREGEIRSFIQNLINLIKEQNFSLIYSLTLNDFQISNDSAEIKLLLRTREFIEKDIKLNITLNYIY